MSYASRWSAHGGLLRTTGAVYSTGRYSGQSTLQGTSSSPTQLRWPKRLRKSWRKCSINEKGYMKMSCARVRRLTTTKMNTGHRTTSNHSSRATAKKRFLQRKEEQRTWSLLLCFNKEKDRRGKGKSKDQSIGVNRRLKTKERKDMPVDNRQSVERKQVIVEREKICSSFSSMERWSVLFSWARTCQIIEQVK